MSAALFRLLLRLYPADFRRRWEEEMVYTFELQLLADGWFQAWTCALAELAPVSNEVLAVPLVSVASAGVLFTSLWWALENGRRLGSLYIHLVAKLSG